MALTPRLHGPYPDFPGAPSSLEGRQVMTIGSGRQYSQPPEQLQTRPGGGEDIRMVAQLEARTINHEQLIAEVRGILAGLLLVEAKCPEAHAKQTATCHCGRQPKLNNEQLQALIALHHTLSRERHDSLASQRPSAGPSLRRSAPGYPAPVSMRCRQRGRNPGQCWSKGHNRRSNRGRRWHCGR